MHIKHVWCVVHRNHFVCFMISPDKAESVLDRMTHVPNNPIFYSNAETSADHYHHFRDDLAMAKEMKVEIFLFTLVRFGLEQQILQCALLKDCTSSVSRACFSHFIGSILFVSSWYPVYVTSLLHLVVSGSSKGRH